MEEKRRRKARSKLARFQTFIQEEMCRLRLERREREVKRPDAGEANSSPQAA